ncbi:MAG: HTH domain-containing protein [Rhodobacteraceae bacterium]|nr:HTH domain-containing protein [Paracoccaceae bacterium]
MTRDDRMYELIQIMRDGRLHTATELATRMGVSPRTIWRDMSVMARSGLPVEGERGLGYILRSPLLLPPTLMKQDELDALVEGLTLVATAESPLSRAARSLLSKIATLMPQAGIEERTVWMTRNPGFHEDNRRHLSSDTKGETTSAEDHPPEHSAHLRQ